jgi:hypothetical protein
VNLFRACSRGRAHRRGMGTGEQSGPRALHVASTPARGPISPQPATSFASRRISVFISPPPFLFIIVSQLHLSSCDSVSLTRRVAKLAPPPSPGSITVLVFVNIINPNYASSFFLFCKYFEVAHLVTWININVFNIYTPFFLERM